MKKLILLLLLVPALCFSQRGRVYDSTVATYEGFIPCFPILVSVYIEAYRGVTSMNCNMQVLNLKELDIYYFTRKKKKVPIKLISI